LLGAQYQNSSVPNGRRQRVAGKKAAPNSFIPALTVAENLIEKQCFFFQSRSKLVLLVLKQVQSIWLSTLHFPPKDVFCNDWLYHIFAVWICAKYKNSFIQNTMPKKQKYLASKECTTYFWVKKSTCSLHLVVY